MTIEQIRAALAQAKTEEERAALITQLEQAITARSGDKPSELEQMRSGLADLTSQRSTLASEFEKITTSAVDDKGEAREFTPEESEQRGSLKARIDSLDAQITEREDQIRQAEHEARQKEMDERIAQVRRDLGLGDVAPNSQGGGIESVREQRTYEKGNGRSYMRDLCFIAYGPGAIGAEYFRAMERVQTHGRENHIEALEIDGKATRSDAEEYFLRQMVEVRNERRQNRGPISERAMSYRALSTASTAGGEFVPPMYDTARWIEFLRAGRVVANSMHHEDLPDGTMSLNYPKVKSGTSVAVQATQNTNVSMTDITSEYVTLPVVTFAGGQIVSLQLLERSPIQFDEVIWRDLSKAHAAYVDAQVINGSGSEGQVTGILNTSGITTVTWTQAEPTVKGFYGRVGVGKEKVANALYVPSTHLFVTPNAWEWIGQSFDTQNRPLVVPEYSGPFNAVQVAPDAATAEGVVGRRLSGLDTYEDANIPAELGAGKNQDVAIICRGEENHLLESPIVTRALPQTYGAQLSVLLQLYNYGAFTAARYPKANSVITGTGMASANRTFNS